MAKINWKGGALLAPLPAVMVTCGTMENANVFTVAWTGMISTTPPRAYISVRPTRHSYGILCDRGEFVLNLTTRALCETADYCGMVTGRCVDKMKKCGLLLEPSQTVAAPRLAQSPLSLECRVFDRISLGSHEMFLCDILSVAVDESLIDENGRLCLSRAGLTAFAHGEYYALGRVIGAFGFSMADKKKGRGAVLKPETDGQPVSERRSHAGKGGADSPTAKKQGPSFSEHQGRNGRTKGKKRQT